VTAVGSLEDLLIRAVHLAVIAVVHRARLLDQVRLQVDLGRAFRVGRVERRLVLRELLVRRGPLVDESRDDQLGQGTLEAAALLVLIREAFLGPAAFLV